MSKYFKTVLLLISILFLGGVFVFGWALPVRADDASDLAADKAALVDSLIQGANADLSNITTALTNPLPPSGANGSSITWLWGDASIVSDDGQAVVRPAFGNPNAVLTLTATLTKGVEIDNKIFNLTVLTMPNPDIAAVAADKAALVDGLIQGTNSDLLHITGTLANPLPALGTNGSSISWVSDKPLVISNDGQTVARPAFGSPDEIVTLTATLTKGVVTDTKVFSLTVLALPDPDIALLAADKAALVDSLIQGVNSDLSHITSVLANPLPSLGTINNSIITWLSSNLAIVSNDGQTVVRPAMGNPNASLNLTATLTKGVQTDTKVFSLTVLAIPDLTPPVIAAHSDITVNNDIGVDGAVVTYTTPTTTDNLDPDFLATCLPAPGSLFSISTTTVTCSATDAAGNSATSTTFEVVVNDNEIPAISLIGANPQTVERGVLYADPGSNVTDNHDHTLTAIVDSSSVDTSVVGGPFIVTYDAVDTAGNHAVQVTRTVNVVDTLAPTLSAVAITSDNASTTLAKVGNTITLTFTANEVLSDLPTTTIAGHIVASSNTGGNSYTASYTLIGADTEGVIPFTIDFADAVGNPGTQVTATTDGSAVFFDQTVPTATVGYSTVLLTNQDVLATITPSEPINGTTTHNFTANGSYVFDFTDLAGNAGSSTASVSNIDKDNPYLVNNLIYSSNASNTLAMAGDTVTLEFTANEALKTNPVVNIGTHAANVLASATPNTYTASTTVDSSDSDGPLNFSINLTDLADNTATTSTTTDGSSVTFDKSAPTGVIAYSTILSTNQNVTATVTPSDLVEPVIIVNNSGSPAYVFVANGEFAFALQDAAGNTGWATATVSNIDLIPPVIAAHSDVTINNDPSADGAIVNYSVPTTTDNVDPDFLATCLPASSSFFSIGTTTVTCNATDTAGNPAAPITFDIVVNDNEAPAISLIGANPQTVERATVYPELGANVTDNHDVGLIATIDSSAVSTSTSGSYSVTYDAVDSYGNHAIQVTRTVNVVDTTPPTLTAVSITSSNASTTLAKVGDAITLTFTADETLIGLPTVTIAGHAVLVTNTGGNSYSAGYTMVLGDTEGPINFTIDFTDLAGNPGTQVVVATDGSAVLFDRTVPSSNSTALDGNGLAYAFDTWATTTATVTLTAIDTGSGVADILYSINGAPQATYAAPLVFSSDGTSTLDFFSVDGAGNIEATSSVVVKVDKTAPAGGSISIDGGATYASSTSVNLTIGLGTDSISGLASMQIANASSYHATETPAISKAWTLTAGDAAKTVRVRFYDLAGNISSSVSDTIILDTATPTVGTVSVLPFYAPDFVATTSIISMAATDTTSQIDPASCEYTVDGGASWQAAAYDVGTETCLAVGIDTSLATSVNMRVKDNAGNPSIGTAIAVTPDITSPVTASAAITSAGVYTFDTWTNKDVTVTLTPSDGGSGVNKTYYSTATPDSFVEYTAPVTFTVEGTTTIKYYSIDNIGNEEAIKQKIVKINKTKPIISLTGATEVSLVSGSVYADSGATANDDIDGNITASIIATNPVNTAIVGVYYVEYNVTDSAGNNADTVSRKVTIYEPSHAGGIVHTVTPQVLGVSTNRSQELARQRILRSLRLRLNRLRIQLNARRYLQLNQQPLINQIPEEITPTTTATSTATTTTTTTEQKPKKPFWRFW